MNTDLCFIFYQQNPGKTLAVSQASLVSQMAQLSSPIPSVSYEEPLQTLSCQTGSSLPVHIFLPHGSHITSAESADQDMASGVAQVSQTAEEHRTNDRQETTQFPTQVCMTPMVIRGSWFLLYVQ